MARKKTRAGGKKAAGANPVARKAGAYGSPGGMPICVNAECKLRKKGCKGFEGCPGYKAR